MEKMKDSVMSHPLVKKYSLFSSTGAPEKVMRGLFNNIYSQIRIDWTNGVILSDLKTCDDIDNFEYSAKKFMYDIQMGFYQGVFEEITGHKPDCYIVAVETLESHRSGVWLLDNEMLRQKKLDIKSSIQQLIVCTHENRFVNKYRKLKVLSF